MTKTKERSEVEYLRSELKKMQKQIKHLKKEVARKNKRAHQYHDLETRQAEEQLDDLSKDNEYIEQEKCPKCSSDLEVLNLGNRQLNICSNCNWRSPSKVIK